MGIPWEINIKFFEQLKKLIKDTRILFKIYTMGLFPIRENARRGYILKPVETISGETESKITIDT